MSVVPTSANDPVPSQSSLSPVQGSATSQTQDGYIASPAATRPGLSPGPRTGLGAASVPAASLVQARPDSPASSLAARLRHLLPPPSSGTGVSATAPRRARPFAQLIGTSFWEVERGVLQEPIRPSPCFFLRPRGPWLGL